MAHGCSACPGEAIGGDSAVGRRLDCSHCFRVCRGGYGILFIVSGGGGLGFLSCACLAGSWWRGDAQGVERGAMASLCWWNGAWPVGVRDVRMRDASSMLAILGMRSPAMVVVVLGSGGARWC
jgi:hypothetical protein